MHDVLPIKRSVGERHVRSIDDVVSYLQRVIHPELQGIRSLLAVMLSAGEELAVSFGDDLHLGTSAPSASFLKLNTVPAVLDRQVRCVFDPTLFPAINLARTRKIYVEYWLSASGAGGTPEVALFNDVTGVQITGSVQAHTLGTTAAVYLLGPLAVGGGAVELHSTTYAIRGRDPGVLVNPIIEQARFLVRYK